MYKFIALLFSGTLLLSLQKTFAQQDSTLAQRITTEFCIEFSKKDFTKFSDSKMELGMLIMPLVTKYNEDIKKQWGLSYENEAEFEKIGEKIGQEAAMGCPKFFDFIKNNLGEIEEEGNDIKSVTGILQRIEDQLFSSLIIKTKTGKEEKFWWFQFFEGSEDLTKNPARLLKKNITLKFMEMEVYDAKLKEYRTIKVIKDLTVN